MLLLLGVRQTPKNLWWVVQREWSFPRSARTAYPSRKCICTFTSRIARRRSLWDPLNVYSMLRRWEQSFRRCSILAPSELVASNQAAAHVKPIMFCRKVTRSEAWRRTLASKLQLHFTGKYGAQL